MISYHPSETQPRVWADRMALVFLSLASPLIAACIQSVWVFRSDHWIYQAVIGGAWFHYDENPGQSTLLFIFGACGGLAIPTCLLLLAFRKGFFLPRLIWMGSIVFWTWIYFATAPTLK